MKYTRQSIKAGQDYINSQYRTRHQTRPRLGDNIALTAAGIVLYVLIIVLGM